VASELNSPNITGVVLAAGSGTRMKSQRSKVLHRLAGRPLFHYPVLSALRAGASSVVIVASPSNRQAIEDSLESLRQELALGDSPHGQQRPAPGVERRVELRVAVQEVALGSGDAARAALSQISGELVLIINGDTPLVTEVELQPLLAALNGSNAALALASCVLSDPTGYGRILRATDGSVTEIREHKDLQTEAERAVLEVNAGMYVARREFLAMSLPLLTPANAQGEYYITDLVTLAAKAGGVTAVVSAAEQLEGINDKVQLARLEQRLFQRIADAHRLRGVTIRGYVEVDDTVCLEPDVELANGVALRGRTTVGARSTIDQGSVVTDSAIDRDVTVKAYSVISESRVGASAQVGPFAHLRPRSVLEAGVHLGNFVETKATLMRKGSKANHLAYLGDGDVGEQANIGAGTIFCNYDGFNKSTTRIGKGAFIGSDSQLIAPVSVGDGAYVATGTTVTEDVPADALAISRPRQTNKPGYANTLRAKLRARAERVRKAH
jgi:bifunctional UDP-N-acetylglucosamine pyrophosphorylase/glucosamine-1-phosphate N-acetyltransferase